MRRFTMTLAVGIGVLALAPAAEAAIVTYTFNSPQFTVGQTTPLLNRAPNVGDPTFLTSFTSVPTAAAFQIQPFAANPLLSGNVLFIPAGGNNDLILTFNTPIDSLTVDFALNSPPGGRLDLITPVGGTSLIGGNVGGGFPGGTLSFSSATPFTTATLRGFNVGGVRTEFAIDDLTLNTAAAIPEPASLAVLGALLAGGAVARRRYRAA